MNPVTFFLYSTFQSLYAKARNSVYSSGQNIEIELSISSNLMLLPSPFFPHFSFFRNFFRWTSFFLCRDKVSQTLQSISRLCANWYYKLYMFTLHKACGQTLRISHMNQLGSRWQLIQNTGMYFLFLLKNSNFQI